MNRPLVSLQVSIRSAVHEAELAVLRGSDHVLTYIVRASPLCALLRQVAPAWLMAALQPHIEWVGPDDLTESERLLWKAFGRGQWVDLGSGAAGPSVIRAEVIAALLLGASGAEPGSTAGVRLRGAAVTGRLDLMVGTAAWPLVCDGCRFETEIALVDSSLRTVCILNCELPAFDGTRLCLEGILDLTGSRVAGTVYLQQARVSGNCGCAGFVRGPLVRGPWPSWREGCPLTGKRTVLACKPVAWPVSRAPP